MHMQKRGIVILTCMCNHVCILFYIECVLSILNVCMYV